MKQPASSGSDGNATRCADMDDRKRKRIISNRESARRSRMRKQQRVDELTNQVAQLKRENETIEEKMNVVADMYVNISYENNILRAQLDELANRLQSLNSMLHIADIPQIPETLIEPWQLPCPASTSIFQC